MWPLWGYEVWQHWGGTLLLAATFRTSRYLSMPQEEGTTVNPRLGEEVSGDCVHLFFFPFPPPYEGKGVWCDTVGCTASVPLLF